MSDSCDLMDGNLPDSSVHEIFPARILEWVVISFSGGSSWPRDQTWVLNPSLLRCRQILYCGATREAPGVLCTPFNFFLFKSPRCVTLYLLNKNSHFCCDFSPPLHHIPRILVSQPGIEPRLQQWKYWALTTELQGNSHVCVWIFKRNFNWQFR